MRRANETSAINPRHITERPKHATLPWGTNCYMRTNDNKLPFGKCPVWAFLLKQIVRVNRFPLTVGSVIVHLEKKQVSNLNGNT